MNWINVKLGKLLQARDNRFKPNDPDIAGFKRVEKIDFLGQLYLSNSPSKTDMILVKEGDLLISGINVSKGAFTVYEGSEDIVATIHYSSYVINNKLISTEFLKCFLRSTEFIDAVKEQVPGGIKTEIKPKHIIEIVVKIPSTLEEQNSIVNSYQSYFDKYLSLSNEISYQLESVDQLRQAFLKEAMQGKLVPQDPKDEPASELLKRIKAEKAQLIKEKKLKPGKELPPIKPEEIPYSIPPNWVWCRFADVVDIQSNIVDSLKYPNHPHISPENIEKNTGKLLPYRTISQDEVRSPNHYFYPRQLLYSKVRPRLNKVVEIDFEGLCSADMYPLRPKVISGFIQFYMLSQYFLTEVDKYDNRVKMPKINQPQLSQIPIPLPPLEEQKRIVERLKNLMHLCNELKTSIEHSKNLNDRLLKATLREALTPC